MMRERRRVNSEADIKEEVLETELVDTVHNKTGLRKADIKRTIHFLARTIESEVKKGRTVRVERLGSFLPKNGQITLVGRKT